MNNSDYLSLSNNQIIEEFKGGMGAVGGGGHAGSGSFGSHRGSSSLSARTNSIGGGKQYGSFGYASVSPVTGAMSGLANVQPGSVSGLGVIKGGAKTGTFTGGSFGGQGKYVVGFPGIRPGSSLPASSMPSMYVKPKPKEVKSTIATGPVIRPDVTKPYGHIDKHITPGIPGPRIGNYRDNVNHNHATKIRGPKYPYGFDLRDKNLTGYYGYSGSGYFFDPFYWGYGPWWPVNNIYLDYPDIPYNYEDLMQKEIDADNLVNTVQDQIATQLMEQEGIPEEQEAEQEVKEEKVEKKEDKKKETFQNSEQGNKQCNKNNILVVLTVVLIIYLLFILPLSETENSFSL